MVEDLGMTSLIGALILSVCVGKSKKSPLIWLAFGCICIAAYSYDMWNWDQSPLLAEVEKADPAIRDELKESIQNEYNSALYRVVAGALIVLGSIYYYVRRKDSNQSAQVNPCNPPGNPRIT